MNIIETVESMGALVLVDNAQTWSRTALLEALREGESDERDYAVEDGSVYEVDGSGYLVGYPGTPIYRPASGWLPTELVAVQVLVEGGMPVRMSVRGDLGTGDAQMAVEEFCGAEIKPLTGHEFSAAEGDDEAVAPIVIADAADEDVAA